MMNKAQILKKIGNIIEELNEQQQYLTTANKINLLELELFTANADFLIDHIEILKKLNEKPEIKTLEEAPIAPKNEVKEAILELPTQTEEDEPKKKFNFSFEEPTEMVFDFEKRIAVEEVFDRALSDEEKRLLEEKQTEKVEIPLVKENIANDSSTEQKKLIEDDDEQGPEPFLVVKEEVKPEKTPTEDSAIIIPPVKKTEEIPHYAEETSAEDKGEKRLTLNEMLSAKLNQNNSALKKTQSSKKIEDLKTAISINDKMVFIKELFNGYNLAYSEAIEILNRFETIEAADNFLQKNYAVKNDWESKQNTVSRFYEYLNKKFIL